ncbi:MAG: helix-turn-helix transcriptional regulator [Arcanobacterium sp.]|nr:helix-turn-helix transcriptional regulator [Arcanobacterium sp.]
MIKVNLNVLLAQRGMSVAEFAQAVDITPANVAVLKNGRAKAIRFSTLERICQVLDCSIAEILEYVPDKTESEKG